MLTDAEWNDAYEYLLTRLRMLGAEQAASEIQDAAGVPVKRMPSTDERMLLTKVAKRELSRTALERPTPADIFNAAMLVLEARLIHLPAVLGALRDRYGDRTLSFISEYGTDPRGDERENELLRTAFRQRTSIADLKRATDALISLAKGDQ